MGSLRARRRVRGGNRRRRILTNKRTTPGTCVFRGSFFAVRCRKTRDAPAALLKFDETLTKMPETEIWTFVHCRKM